MCKYNEGLRNNVTNMKKHLQESKSKNKDKYITKLVEENSTKRLENKFARRLMEP